MADTEENDETNDTNNHLVLQEKLIDSLLQNDLQTFRNLIHKKGADPNYKYVNYRKNNETYCGNCLEIASAIPGCSDIVRYLLSHGINPNTNIILKEPIHIAAENGNHRVLEVLLEDRRTNVNSVDSFGDTALHLAIRKSQSDDKVVSKNYERCFELLLQHTDINVNIRNSKGLVPIHEAVLQRAKNAVVYILTKCKHSVDIDMLGDNVKTVGEIILNNYPELCDLLPRREVLANQQDKYNKILTALLEDEQEEFKAIVNQVDLDGNPLLDLDHWYERPYNARLLDIASNDKRYNAYVAMLIAAGADPNIVNVVTGKAPIHMVVEIRNSTSLKVLIESEDINVNILDASGRSALHILVRGSNENESERIKCISLLLSHKKINVNICDKEGRTPLFLSALLRDEPMVKEMLEKGDTKLDLLSSQEMDKRKSICDLLTTTFPHLESRIAEIKTQESYETYLKNLLFQYLYNHQSLEFVEKFQNASENKEQLEVNRFDDGNDTLLQCAVIQGMEDAVRVILSNGADPFKVTRNNPIPPISLAIDRDFIEIFNIIMNFSNKNVETPDNKRQTPLHHSVKRQNLELINRILETGCHVNARDGKGNTALHIAIRKGNLECVKMLLKYNADVNLRNSKGDTPLHLACRKDDKEIVVELLNHGANIKIRNVLDKEPLSVKMMESLFDDCLKTNNKSPENPNYEIILDYNLLLAHENWTTNSIIDKVKDTEDEDNESFMKQSKNSSYFTEMNIINDITKSDTCSCLVKHPLIKAFLHLKWKRVRAYYHANLTIYCIFVLLLNIFVQYGLYGHSVAARYSWITLFPFLVYFIIREMLQFLMSRKRYIDNSENLLDVCLIIITVTTMFSMYLRSPVRELMQITATLLSWAELVMLTGRHPKLSKNIEMFKMVTKTYASLFISYIFLILAFAFCFRIILSGSRDVNLTYFYDTPMSSIFRTFLMMLGDFYTSPSIYTTSAGFVTYATVLFFLFLIVLVLVNLLTALTVSDIQQFKVKAEELSISTRIQLIYDIEDILLECRKFCDKYVYVSKTVNFVHRNLQKLNYFNKNFNRTYLFSKSNSFKVVRILPNQRGRVITNEKCVYEWKISKKLLGEIIEKMSKKGNISTEEELKARIEELRQDITNIKKINEKSVSYIEGIRVVCTKNYECACHLLNSTTKNTTNDNSIADVSQSIKNVETKVTGIENKISECISQLSTDIKLQNDECSKCMEKLGNEIETLSHNVSGMDERLLQNMEQNQLLHASNKNRYESLEMSEAECKKLLSQILEIVQRKRR